MHRIHAYNERSDPWIGWLIVFSVAAGIDGIASVINGSEGHYNVWATLGFALPLVLHLILTVTAWTWGIRYKENNELACNYLRAPKGLRKELNMTRRDFDLMTKDEIELFGAKLEQGISAYNRSNRTGAALEYLDAVIITDRELN